MRNSYTHQPITSRRCHLVMTCDATKQTWASDEIIGYTTHKLIDQQRLSRTSILELSFCIFELQQQLKQNPNEHQRNIYVLSISALKIFVFRIFYLQMKQWEENVSCDGIIKISLKDNKSSVTFRSCSLTPASFLGLQAWGPGLRAWDLAFQASGEERSPGGKLGPRWSSVGGCLEISTKRWKYGSRNKTTSEIARKGVASP